MSELADRILNVRGSKMYQINASVPKSKAHEVAEALEFLMRWDVTKSKSALVCEAIIYYAHGQGLEENDESTSLPE